METLDFIGEYLQEVGFEPLSQGNSTSSFQTVGEWNLMT